MLCLLQQYWASSSPYRYYSVPDFAEEFKQFHVGRSTLERLAEAPDRAELEKQANGRELLIKKKYALTNGQLFKACWEVRTFYHSRHVESHCS